VYLKSGAWPAEGESGRLGAGRVEEIATAVAFLSFSDKGGIHRRAHPECERSSLYGGGL